MRCTSSQIVDFGINLSKILNNRNMVKVTKERTVGPRRKVRHQS